MENDFVFDFTYRSGELREEYNSLMIEKAELQRGIFRRQLRIKTLLADIKTLYQVKNFHINKLSKLLSYSLPEGCKQFKF
jgi:hypothetical protein